MYRTAVMKWFHFVFCKKWCNEQKTVFSVLKCLRCQNVHTCVWICLVWQLLVDFDIFRQPWVKYFWVKMHFSEIKIHLHITTRKYWHNDPVSVFICSDRVVFMLLLTTDTPPSTLWHQNTFLILSLYTYLFSTWNTFVQIDKIHIFDLEMV